MACKHGMEDYCLECVYENARLTCRAKNESWRWGEAKRDPLTGKDAK
jgi:hypothetical protein